MTTCTPRGIAPANGHNFAHLIYLQYYCLYANALAQVEEVRTLYLLRWCTSMITNLGENTALPAYLHVSGYATLDILSLINHSTSPSIRKRPLLFP